MPAGRPKGDATRIKELEERIKHLESELARAIEVTNRARSIPNDMWSIFYNIEILADHIYGEYPAVPEHILLANIQAIGALAAKGQTIEF